MLAYLIALIGGSIAFVILVVNPHLNSLTLDRVKEQFPGVSIEAPEGRLHDEGRWVIDGVEKTCAVVRKTLMCAESGA
ncbi:hypothetical protein AB3M81_08310 [Aeromicrobium sp. 179-A 4D2 NHS]